MNGRQGKAIDKEEGNMKLKIPFVTLKNISNSLYKAWKHFVKVTIIQIAKLAGSPAAFMCSLLAVMFWAISGPYFGFSDTWQLVINTGTTIITFLMAFTIQYTQNRDTKQITMMLKSLMRQNQALQEQLEAIEQEMEEE
jgi:low affinity Fe/Cu permease